MSGKRPGKSRRMGSSRRDPRGSRIQRREGQPEDAEIVMEEDSLAYAGLKEGGEADEQSANPPNSLGHIYESEKPGSTTGDDNPICNLNPESVNTVSIESVEKSRVSGSSSPEEPRDSMGMASECLHVDEAHDTSLPGLNRREKRRKLGSTRKSSHKAKVQTETAVEEDVIMDQGREEGEESSLLEDEFISETAVPSEEIQAVKQEEKRIHHTTDQEKGMEFQMGDRETSAITTHFPEMSDDSEQAEQPNLSVKDEEQDKEERGQETEIEQIRTDDTPGILDYSDQAEHSTFEREKESHTDTQLAWRRKENEGYSQAESINPENIFEDTVALDQPNQSKDDLLTEIDSALCTNLNDPQQMSLELEPHAQKSEEEDMRNVEPYSPDADSKGGVLFILAEESKNEIIKENTERKEERSPEKCLTVISPGQLPEIVEQSQNPTTTEPVETPELQNIQLPLLMDDVPFRYEGEVSVQGGEADQARNGESGIELEKKDTSAETMASIDTTIIQDTSLPTPKRTGRRKLGSTRKSSRKPEVQTETAKEEDAMMDQEREEGEESSLLEDEFISETPVPPEEMQAEKQEEKWIHHTTDQEKGMEFQMGDRETSGITTHFPEMSDDSEQAEQPNLSVKDEEQDKEERGQESEIEQIRTDDTPGILDNSDQVGHSTFEREKESHTDTQLTHARTENEGYSQAESTNHEKTFEDTVILDQLNQSEGDFLTEKVYVSTNLNDPQQMSLELEHHALKREDGDMGTVEQYSPDADNKGGLLCSLAEESKNEKIDENTERKEERSPEKCLTDVSSDQSHEIVEQSQNPTIAEPVETLKLQDTQLPLLMDDVPFRYEGEVSVQGGEGDRAHAGERGMSPESKDTSAETMTFMDTTIIQDRSLPTPKRTGRRKLGSTRKSSRKPEARTETAKEEDAVMELEREEGESSLLEDEFSSETAVPSEEIQSEKQEEKIIHHTTDQDKEMECQMGDRDTSGINTHSPEMPDHYEQAEQPNLSVTNEEQDKEERGQETEIEQIRTDDTPGILDYSDQAEHSTFEREKESHTDTQLARRRNENEGYSQAESINPENIFEDTVILDQPNQSKDDLLTEIDSALCTNLNDSQQMSLELEPHAQKSEEEDMRNVEPYSPDADSKGGMLFILAEESRNEKTEENTERKEERSPEKCLTVISPGQLPEIVEQSQNPTMTEPVETPELQDTQLPLLMDDVPFRYEGEVRVQGGETDQAYNGESGVELEKKDISLETMTFMDTTMIQDTSLPTPKRTGRRKLGSTRKSSRKPEVQTETAKEEDAMMEQEREEGEESSLLEDEFSSETAVPSEEIQAVKQEGNRIHHTTDQEKGMQFQMGDRETSGITTHSPEMSDYSEQAEQSGLSVTNEEQDKEERGQESEIKQIRTDDTPISDYTDQAEQSTFIRMESYTNTQLTFTRTESMGHSVTEVTSHDNLFEDSINRDGSQQRSPELENLPLKSEEVDMKIDEENSPEGENEGGAIFTLAEESGNGKIKENKDREEERKSEMGQTFVSNSHCHTTLERSQNSATAEQVKTAKLQGTQPPFEADSMPFRCEDEIIAQEGEGKQGHSDEGWIDVKHRSEDTMEHEAITLPWEMSIPVPNEGQRRRKMGSTRKSSRRAKEQTEKCEEEDVMMQQVREEGEQSLLLEEELVPERGAPSGKIQAGKWKEKSIHQTTEEQKGMERQLKERETSDISTHILGISQEPEQGEHSTFSLKNDRENKEDRQEEREMEQAETSHTAEISDCSDQVKKSTFVSKKEPDTDTQLTFGRTENVEHSVTEVTSHENLFENTVILDQLQQSQDSLLMENDSPLSTNLDDSQQRSPKLGNHPQKREEAEIKIVEENCPKAENKCDVIFTLAEESDNEKIEEDKESEEERKSEMGQTFASHSHSHTTLDSSTAEQLRTVQLQGTQPPFVMENMHLRCDDNIGGLEEDQGQRGERGAESGTTDESADTMDATLTQETSLPLPTRDQRRRKLGSTRKSSRRAKVQTGTGEEEDVMRQEGEEIKESSWLEEGFRSETAAPSGEMQAEEDKEMSIHPSPEHPTFSVEKEWVNKEENKEQEMEQVGMYHTCDISDMYISDLIYLEQAELAKELESIPSTQLTPGRQENVAFSATESTKHETLIDDSIFIDQRNPPVHSLHTEKTSDLTVSLHDSQCKSLELDSHTQQLCHPKNTGRHSADEDDSSAVPHRRRKMGSTRKGLQRSTNQEEKAQLREQRENKKGEDIQGNELVGMMDRVSHEKEIREQGEKENRKKEDESIMSSIQLPTFVEPPEGSVIAGKQDKTSQEATPLPAVRKKLGSSRKGRSNVWKGGRDPGQANEMGIEEDTKASAVLQRIQEVFHHWDPEEKGFITWDHMQGLGGELGLSVEELRLVFDRLDKDRDGLVTPQDVTAGFREYMQFQKPRARPSAIIYQSDASILPEEEDDCERKLFLSMLDDLRDYGLLKDQSEIWRLWVELQHNEPHLLKNLEDFVSKVTEQIKTVQLEKESLEQALKRNIQQHSVGVKELYEEMERQITAEKERVKEESKEKSRSQLAKVEEELNQKNREIQALNAVQKQLEGSLRELRRQQRQSGVEKEELFRANEELEEQLERVRAQLQETMSHVHALRSAHAHEQIRPHLHRPQQTEACCRPESEKRDFSQEAMGLERSESVLHHRSPEDTCAGAQGDARRRVISIEEDPIPDLLTGSQALTHRNQGEATWEKQRSSMSSAGHSPSVLDLLYNVVLVGDSSVGKTCFMRRFQSGEFSPDLCATVGLDSCIQTVQVEGRRVILQVWDTAGQERYHSITKQILRKGQGLVLMYDITSANSFRALPYWLSSIQEGAPDDVIIMLLGNKNDSYKREVPLEEGERLAREYNINFMECSAATGDNVEQAMNNLARMLKQQVDKKQENVTLHKGSPKKKSWCCG